MKGSYVGRPHTATSSYCNNPTLNDFSPFSTTVFVRREADYLKANRRQLQRFKNKTIDVVRKKNREVISKRPKVDKLSVAQQQYRLKRQTSSKLNSILTVDQSDLSSVLTLKHFSLHLKNRIRPASSKRSVAKSARVQQQTREAGPEKDSFKEQVWMLEGFQNVIRGECTIESQLELAKEKVSREQSKDIRKSQNQKWILKQLGEYSNEAHLALCQRAAESSARMMRGIHSHRQQRYRRKTRQMQIAQQAKIMRTFRLIRSLRLKIDDVLTGKFRPSSPFSMQGSYMMFKIIGSNSRLLQMFLKKDRFYAYTFNHAHQTPLIIAAIKGTLQDVHVILQHHPNVDHTDRYNKSALYYSVATNSVHITKALLLARANPWSRLGHKLIGGEQIRRLLKAARLIWLGVQLSVSEREKQAVWQNMKHKISVNVQYFKQ